MIRQTCATPSITRFRVVFYSTIFASALYIGAQVYLAFDDSESRYPDPYGPRNKVTEEQIKRMLEESKIRTENIKQTHQVLLSFVNQWDKISSLPLLFSGANGLNSEKSTPQTEQKKSDQHTNSAVMAKWLNPPLSLQSKSTNLDAEFEYRYNGEKYPVKVQSKVDTNIKAKSKVLFYFDSYAGQLLSCVLPVLETDVRYAEIHYMNSSELPWLDKLSASEKKHLDNKVKSTLRPQVEKMTSDNESDYLEKLTQNIKSIFEESRKNVESADILLKFQSQK